MSPFFINAALVVVEHTTFFVNAELGVDEKIAFFVNTHEIVAEFH